MKDYKVIRAVSNENDAQDFESFVSEFQNEVIKHLEEGYEVAGGISVTETNDWVCFHQSLIKIT